MIYFDNAATTRPNARSVERANVYLTEEYFNPSALYRGGFTVSEEIKRAREYLLSRVADPVNFDLTFTSCGTEADNHAVFSCAKRGNAVTTDGEHAAIHASFSELKNRGVEPRFARILEDGRVDEAHLLSLIDEKTTFVSVIHVNNETGAINNIAQLAKKVKAKNPRCVFHSDGVQAFGKIPVYLPKEVDLYSISAHKIGGLKGVGGLIRRKSLALSPYLYGGGQEKGLRSGTENVFGILSFRYAAEDKFSSLVKDAERIKEYRETLASLLDGELFKRLSPVDGTPYILSVSAVGLRGEVLQRMLSDNGLVVGTGSACSSKHRFSRVMTACGYDEKTLDGVLRISFSPETTEDEVKRAATVLNATSKELKIRTK
ncbi:MAG: cysteine desulfurase [Clostridia bacterium]|nr:cysteine desulfurase [Clostridia bacterium]